jgi:uncharacterized protein (DUF924 family)
MTATLKSFSDYWFSKFDDLSCWFYEGFHHDAEVEQFRELLHAVVNQAIVPETISEHLLVIVMMDQLPRHFYRGTVQAYELDDLALRLAKQLYERGWHTQLSTWELIFWTTVFEHSEDLDEHLFARKILVERIDQHEQHTEDRRHLEHTLLYLDKHSAVVRSFRRYPKRAEVRGSPLTDAEKKYLADRVGKPY